MYWIKMAKCKKIFEDLDQKSLKQCNILHKPIGISSVITVLFLMSQIKIY